jgi:hypothetical protein
MRWAAGEADIDQLLAQKYLEQVGRTGRRRIMAGQGPADPGSGTPDRSGRT